VVDDAILKNLIKNPEKINELEYEIIIKILNKAKIIFAKEKLLLDLHIPEKESEVYIIGDIHGNLDTLMALIKIFNQKKPELVVFLGDIVDRGTYQLECLIIVLALKILYPKRYYLIRGNHETYEMNRAYGFYYAVAKRFEKKKCIFDFIDLYNVLPVCALINNKILCLHGGIPNDIKILEKIKDLTHADVDRKIYKEIAGSIFQMMWNDPEPGIKGFIESVRGPGIYYFGKEAFKEFLEANNLEYIIRAHEVYMEGYRWFFNNRLLSIFTSANYRGKSYPNLASYAKIKNGKILPKIVKLLND